MEYINIPPNLELEIRKEFSLRLLNFKVLKKWIEDAIGQIVIHDTNLYRCSTRVKEISSVLRKIDDKIGSERKKINAKTLKPENATWSNVTSYKEIEPLIDDWVGCRIISYLHDHLPEVHKSICKHDRLVISKMTIYDSKEEPQFKNIKPNKKRGDELRYSENGYIGIHYIIKPKTVDPCFNSHPVVFDKFELQIRTLLQETWGQIQHEAIYKGRLPEEIKTERNSSFQDVARMLRLCDVTLARLAKTESIETPKHINVYKRPELKISKRKILQKNLNFK